MATIYDTQPDWYGISRDAFSSMDRLSAGKLALAQEELQARRAEEALRLELAMRGEANAKIQELSNQGRLDVQKLYNEGRSTDQKAYQDALTERAKIEAANAMDLQAKANLGRLMTEQERNKANLAVVTRNEELQKNLAPLVKEAYETISTSHEKFDKLEEELNGMVIAARERVHKSPEVTEALRLDGLGLQTSFAQKQLIAEYRDEQDKASDAVVMSPAYQLKAAYARSIIDGVTASYRLLEGWGIRAPGAFEDAGDWVNSMNAREESRNPRGSGGGSGSGIERDVYDNDEGPLGPFGFRVDASGIAPLVTGDAGDRLLPSGTIYIDQKGDPVVKPSPYADSPYAVEGGGVPFPGEASRIGPVDFGVSDSAIPGPVNFGVSHLGVTPDNSNATLKPGGITINPQGVVPGTGSVNPYAIGPAEALRILEQQPPPPPLISPRR